MRSSGVTRRGLAAGLTAVVAPPVRDAAPAEDPLWNGLVRDLEVAQDSLRTAMANFSAAERRYFALPRRQRRGLEPDWYVSAGNVLAKTSDFVEHLSLKIARTPAHSRAALALKMRLLAAACDQDPDSNAGKSRQSDDLASSLIQSLLADLTGR